MNPNPNIPKKKLAILINTVAPYRAPIYEYLSEVFDTRILQGKKESNRAWNVPSTSSMQIETVPGLLFKSRTMTGIPGLYDTHYIHISIGLLWRLPQLRPDIIVTNEMGARTLIALLYGSLSHTPVWIWSGGTLHSERHVSGVRKLLRAFIVRKARRWISYGAEATEYLASLGVPRCDVLQIQNCVRQETFQQPRRTATSPFAGYPGPVFLGVGQLIARKGFDVLIKACGRLASRGHAFTLVLVGQGTEKQNLLSLAQESGLHNIVILPNADQAELNDLYHSADFLVFPTLEDIWGLVVNEALIAGLPVLCSRYAGAASELVPQKNIFDPLVPESIDAVLTAALQGQIEKPEPARMLSWQAVAKMIGDSLERNVPITQTIPQAESASDQAKRLRVAMLTSILLPNRVALMEALSPYVAQLRVFLSVRQEPDRMEDPDWGSLDVTVQRSISWRHAFRNIHGYPDVSHMHVPYDTFHQLQNYCPDVVITNQFGVRTFMSILYCAVHPKTRLVLWATLTQHTEATRGWMRKLLRRWMLSRLDAAFVNGADGESYLRALGYQGPTVAVPYVADDLSPSGARPAQDRQHLHLLYAGQLIERKGVCPFTNVLSKWCKDHPDTLVHFTLAGEGPERTHLEQIETPSNLILDFAGRLNKTGLADAYRNASLYVFPTLGDEWGVVVNESLGAGVPILASTYSGAVKELVHEGINGWLFDAYDPNSTYQGIDRALTTSTSTLAEMSRRAKESVAGITPAAMASRIAATIASLATPSDSVPLPSAGQ